MRAMRADQFSGYEGLKLVDLPKPAVSDGKVLLRITAAGVTPLDHTILSGQFHHSEGAASPRQRRSGRRGGWGRNGLSRRLTRDVLSASMALLRTEPTVSGLPYGRKDLCLIPDNIHNVSAAGIPVAYLTARVALTLAGFRAGKTVLAPAIGGSIGNAVTQLARALGAKHAMSSTTNHAKAEQAKALGFNEVIDTSLEKLGDGVRRITGDYGADIVIDGIGGEVLARRSEHLRWKEASQHWGIPQAVRQPLT